MVIIEIVVILLCVIIVIQLFGLLYKSNCTTSNEHHDLELSVVPRC